VAEERREKGEGRREKGEGRREKGEGRSEGSGVGRKVDSRGWNGYGRVDKQQDIEKEEIESFSRWRDLDQSSRLYTRPKKKTTKFVLLLGWIRIKTFWSFLAGHRHVT
jgi:hypothetical protein